MVSKCWLLSLIQWLDHSEDLKDETDTEFAELPTIVLVMWKIPERKRLVLETSREF